MSLWPASIRRLAIGAPMLPSPMKPISMVISFVFSSRDLARRGLVPLPLLPALDLIEFCERTLEFTVEQPHRVEDLAKRRRFLRPVGWAEGEDAVVAQIAHDPGVGNPVTGQIAGPQRRPRRRRNDLDQLEEFHLIDRIGKHFYDGRDLHEELRVGAHQAVAHSNPMVEPEVQMAEARFFFVVASSQRGIEGGDLLFDSGPFLAATPALGYAGLHTSFVFVRARIADVLMAVGLGKENTKPDETCSIDSRSRSEEHTS